MEEAEETVAELKNDQIQTCEGIGHMTYITCYKCK